MATAAERTELIQLVVGMFGAAPGADVLADLEAIFDAGASISDIAVALSENALFSGDTGSYPAFLPNAIFATNFVTDLIGDEVSAENLQLAIDAVTGLLNAGESRGAVVAIAISAVAAVDPADTNFGAAASALTNKTAVAEYYSVTVAQQAATVAELEAVLDGVTSDAATVATAEAAVDAAIPAVPLDVPAALAALEAAEDAVAAFLTENETTDAEVLASVGNAKTAYDALVTGSDLGNDSDALEAALLSDQEAANAAILDAANTALADANAAVDAVAGLTAAVAADAAADDAVTATAAAAAATQTTLDAEEAGWAITGTASADADAVNNNAGVLEVTTNAGSAFAGAVVELTTVTDGVAALADADPAYTADQATLFAELQATAGVAEVIAAFNADAAADTAAADAVTAAAATQATVDFLDAPASSDDELAAVGGGFTITTPADAASPTEAEILAEEAALDAAEATAITIAAGTQTALDAATTADGVADAALTAAVTAADTAEFATGQNILTGTIVVNADGTIDGDLGAGVVSIVVDNAGTLEFDAAITAPDADLNALLAATVANEAAEASLATATAADTAADADVTAATAAITAFDTLVTAFDTANSSNDLTSVLAGLETDVENAQATIDALADAVADAAAAATLTDAYTVLTDAVQDAIDAFTDEGFSEPNDVDAAAEFGTAADDIFLAGETDSDIFNFNLIGDDLLFVGTDNTYNDTAIGAGAGQTLLEDAGDVNVLEFFLVQNGADTDVIIETKAFGSESGSDFTTITLIGTDVTDLAVADGFITVA